MKAKKLLLTALAAACLLAGTAALAACGETEKKPDPAPEAHEHAYGEWVITAPTLSAAGSAKKVCDSCEAGTEGHEVTVTLPALTDSGYTKSGDTATCEGKGEATYTVTVDGNEFTFTGETAPKGHAYHEHAAVAETCTTDGNAKYYTCDNCTKVFDAEKAECAQDAWVIAKHHVFEEHAAQDATCAAEGNKLYYTCKNCPKYFDEKKKECEEGSWVLGKSSHSYGDWAITAPTADGTGVAKKTCSVCAAGTEGHELTLTLPALTDSGYSKTEDTATCSSAGEITYTYTKDGNEVSFKVTTEKKNHTLNETSRKEATCEEDGNEAYWQCSECHKYFKNAQGSEEYNENEWVIAKHHTYHENAAVTPSCTTAGNKKYYTCDKCDKVFDENKTECGQNAWVLEATGHTYEEWQVTAPTAEGAGSAKKTCTKCDAGTDGHEVTVELPALTAENLGKYTVEHADGMDKYTYEQDGEKITFEVEAAPADPYALHLGENTITMTDTYAAVDIYTFTVSEEKTYYFTIAQDMLDTFQFLSVTLDGSEDDDGAMTGGRQIYDSSSQEKTFHIALTVGEHKLCFSAGAKGDFTLTISDTAPETDPKIDKLTPTNPVDGGTLANEQTFTVEIDDSVEAGWYCVYLQPYPVLGRATLTVQINGGEEIVLDANRSATQDTQASFSIYAYLKGGDKITYKNTGIENAPILVNMEVHEHDPSGDWEITEPTADTAGKAERKCGGENKVPETFVLPPLNDGGYTSEGVDGGTKYKITVDGVEIEFVIADA